jgi:tRNA1Val (adenine37-N6)-methyltransferase
LANQHFQFKKFIIQQDSCSMKVCTDSCLFGAWVASLIERMEINPETILDIGAGTGLLSLMLAQKSGACIDAVEIEHNAFEQAAENAQASPWKNQIKIFNADIKKWNTPLKYDLIISNPPFYENDLLPEDDGKNISKHSTKLNLEELIVTAKERLSKDGLLAILLPSRSTKIFENIVSRHSLFVKEKVEVKQTLSHNYFRAMFLLEQRESPILKKELTVKNNDCIYSDEFKFLLKDYYLYL